MCMKKLLLITLFSLPSFAYDSITVLDRENGGVRVLCINTFVFVTRDDGGITQMMDWFSGNGWGSLRPVTCRDYINKKEKLEKKAKKK